jgi:hypothetical protein
MTRLSGVAHGRYRTARPDPSGHAGLVLFHIGMRVNRLREPRGWVPVLVAMNRMMRELSDRPELGLLASQGYRSGRTVLVVQFWRDLEALHGWSRSAAHPHLPAWRAFNRAVRATDAVGVFHETFVLGSASPDTLYVDMPPTGLARAVGGEPVVRAGHGRAQAGAG